MNDPRVCVTPIYPRSKNGHVPHDPQARGESGKPNLGGRRWALCRAVDVDNLIHRYERVPAQVLVEPVDQTGCWVGGYCARLRGITAPSQ